MSRPTYGYGADDTPQPDDPRDDSLGGEARNPVLDDEAERYGQVPRSLDDDPRSPGDPAYGTAGDGASGYDSSGYARGGYGAAGYGTAGRDAPGYGASGYGAPSAQDPPVCPRHPDRVAYVRCQRCHRPACPECQRPAAVGVLCVDCAHDMQRQQRASSPRNALGGATASGRPVVTIAIIALCAIAFVGQGVAPGIVEQLLMFAPFRALAMPWTFITSGFLHGGLMHLLLNMYALWIVGQYLERTMGAGRYLGVYLVSIIAGHTAVLLLADPASQSWFTGTVGASGGVFGLFGSLFIVNRRMGAESRQVLVLIAMNLVITFLFPYISWQGHLGGLIVGTATTAALFATRPKAAPGVDRVALARRSALIHAAVIVGAVLVCVALVVVKVLLTSTGAFVGL